jgi:hypothetical protein
MNTKRILKTTLPLLLLIGVLFAFKKKDPSVLVFSKTGAFRHGSIPYGIKANKPEQIPSFALARGVIWPGIAR